MTLTSATGDSMWVRVCLCLISRRGQREDYVKFASRSHHARSFRFTSFTHTSPTRAETDVVKKAVLSL